MKKGIESLKQSVIKDCSKGKNCFSENGCTKDKRTKCFHDYCGKYKWIVERAKHYAEKTNKTIDEVLEIWENDRTYWYMNYYQECNQPQLNSDKIINYDEWITELKQKYGENPKNWAFKCPSCGNVQSQQTFIDNGVGEHKDDVYYNCIGRYKTGIGCSWTLGGLLKINKLSVMKDAKIFPVFEIA